MLMISCNLINTILDGKTIEGCKDFTFGVGGRRAFCDYDYSDLGMINRNYSKLGMIFI